jgi:signal transduction histidine kinase
MHDSDAPVEDLICLSRRVLAATDAQRRAIERELHDGIQQQLIAVAVNVQLARQLAASDLADALRLLEEIGRDVQDALHDVQALAHRVYPAILAARGLADALREAASTAGVHARIKAEGVGRYPASVEATVYFCCQEALLNTATHAGEGARATVLLQDLNDAIRFEVVDDGCGFDARQPLRAGLTHARDRLETLGGELTIASEPGTGTRISGTVPLYEALSDR